MSEESRWLRSILIVLWAIFGLLVALAIAGCEESVANNPANPKPPKRQWILRTEEQWTKMYGDDDETNLYSNVWVLINEVQRLNQRIIALERGGDPNEIRWMPVDLSMIGLRPDGLVIWREAK